MWKELSAGYWRLRRMGSLNAETGLLERMLTATSLLVPKYSAKRRGPPASLAQTRPGLTKSPDAEAGNMAEIGYCSRRKRHGHRRTARDGSNRYGVIVTPDGIQAWVQFIL